MEKEGKEIMEKKGKGEWGRREMGIGEEGKGRMGMKERKNV
jgi:hypothetical protein